MNRLFEIHRISSCLVKESESHGVMGIGDGEPDPPMEQPARRWNKGFAKNHWSNGRGSDKPVSVIKRFGPSAYRTCKKTLVIPGGLTVGIEPITEVSQHFCYAIRSVHFLEVRGEQGAFGFNSSTLQPFNMSQPA